MARRRDSFDLSEFELAAAHCELRLDPAYLLWDRSGTIWSELVEKMPGLRHVKAQPDEQVFRLGRQYELKTRLERFSLHARKPDKSLEYFVRTQADFTRTVEHTLNIEHYKRIGLRLIFAMEVESKAAAMKYLSGRGLFSPSEGPYFGVKGDFTESQRVVRLEGDSSGWTAHLHVEERSYELDMPLEWVGDLPDRTTAVRVVLDIDRYEHGLLPVSQLNVTEWVNAAARAIKRDANKVVKELFGA